MGNFALYGVWGDNVKLAHALGAFAVVLTLAMPARLFAQDAPRAEPSRDASPIDDEINTSDVTTHKHVLDDFEVLVPTVKVGPGKRAVLPASGPGLGRARSAGGRGVARTSRFAASSSSCGWKHVTRVAFKLEAKFVPMNNEKRWDDWHFDRELRCNGKRLHGGAGKASGQSITATGGREFKLFESSYAIPDDARSQDGSYVFETSRRARRPGSRP